MPSSTLRPSAPIERHRVWRSALVAVLPAAIVLSLIAALFGASPGEFLPVWTDEVVYWNESAAFRQAGFEGGYVTVHEQTPRASFSRFGAHGPSFAVFHGSIGRAIGWEPWSAFLINLVVVSLAAFTWLRGSVAGPTGAATLLIATFWPLLLYLPTNMQEPTHFALAFLFALAIERHATGSRVSAWASAAVLLAVALLLRPTWALMLLPLGWQRARRRGLAGVVLLLALTLALAAAAYGAFDLLASPGYQNNLRRVSEAWADSPGRAVAMTVNRATLNLRLWFTTTEDEPPEIALRYFIALFVVVLGVRRLGMRRTSEQAPIVETALLALVPVLAVVLVFGEVESWRDFRVLAPHLLVALLWLASHGRWERWLWAGTLVVVPIYVTGFVELHEERFAANHQAIAEMRRVTADVMPFVPGASPWANTLLVHAELLQHPLVGLPQGIGISYVADWSNLPAAVQSRYLLLRPADREAIADRVALTPLAETPLGSLYRNAQAQ